MLPLLLDFIFPNSCLVCQRILNCRSQAICQKCYMELPFTHWKWTASNPMNIRLKGYLPIEHANSLWYFRKRNATQKILHALKYKDRKDLSPWLAEEWVRIFESRIDFQLICPVPIHPKKRRERGYNQNTAWGSALAKRLQLPYEEEVLKRIQHQKSQTLLHKSERLNRLENTFVYHNCPSQAEHLLLIDDVYTTGATLLHCAELLVSHGKKVSIATLAYAI